MAINHSYPKRRATYELILPISRTDSGTQLAVLPKDHAVVGMHVYQAVNAATAAGSFTLGLGSDADGLITAFSMATTAVGLVNVGTAVGVSFLAKQTADQAITSTYTAGSSTAGGTGYVILECAVFGPGEAVTG